MSETASDGKAQAPPGPSPWTLMLMVLLTLWVCNRPEDPKQGLAVCGKNLHQIGVSLERFRLTAEDGAYPKTLEEAFKSGAVPACPVGGQSTYPSGYRRASDGRSYLLVCQGDHHQAAGVPSDYPRIAFEARETSPAGEESVQQSQPPASPGLEPKAVSPSPQASPQASQSPRPSASPSPSANPQ